MVKAKTELYLDGTENILTDFKDSDKKLILEYASIINIIVPKKVTMYGIQRYALNKKNGYRFNKPYSLVADGVNEALDFYLSNIPKGFVRLDGYYESINKDGTIIRFNRKPVAKYVIRNGYSTVKLYKVNGKSAFKETRVDSLVAKTFLPSATNMHVLKHIDGDNLNNKASNLKYVPRDKPLPRTGKDKLDYSRDVSIRLMRKYGHTEDSIINMRVYIKRLKCESKKKLADKLLITMDDINTIVNKGTVKLDENIFNILVADEYPDRYKGIIKYTKENDDMCDTKLTIRDARKCGTIRSLYYNSYADSLRKLATDYEIPLNVVIHIIKYKNFTYKYILDKEKEILIKEEIC